MLATVVHRLKEVSQNIESKTDNKLVAFSVGVMVGFAVLPTVIPVAKEQINKLKSKYCGAQKE